MRKRTQHWTVWVWRHAAYVSFEATGVFNVGIERMEQSVFGFEVLILLSDLICRERLDGVSKAGTHFQV